mmetsp:Transcript_53728/g.136322  ORF Transcript_53728/g.136322 Transcript_53728/m.136322 type:complete len:327 (+) Transcript_53728:401-1381(+)
MWVQPFQRGLKLLHVRHADEVELTITGHLEERLKQVCLVLRRHHAVLPAPRRQRDESRAAVPEVAQLLVLCQELLHRRQGQRIAGVHVACEGREGIAPEVALRLQTSVSHQLALLQLASVGTSEELEARVRHAVHDLLEQRQLAAVWHVDREGRQGAQQDLDVFLLVGMVSELHLWENDVRGVLVGILAGEHHWLQCLWPPGPSLASEEPPHILPQQADDRVVDGAVAGRPIQVEVQAASLCLLHDLVEIVQQSIIEAIIDDLKVVLVALERGVLPRLRHTLALRVLVGRTHQDRPGIRLQERVSARVPLEAVLPVLEAPVLPVDN